ncbi:MAG TPA: GNAT family N-acetyltransferase [Bryobacteraceae bacterium]|nr:GNAT family N-acetyltransferase [Bryobacteraceae bacterium]
MIPEIVTPRLRLRGHRLEDFPASAAMWTVPSVTRFIGGRALSEEEVWARFLRYAGHWSLFGFGFWAIEELSGGGFVGEAGFAYFKREIQPPIPEIPEAGWVLVPRVHGRGYATEALGAALEWGGKHLPSTSTACMIHPENHASIRLAVKCGFQRSCQTSYKGEPTLIFTRELS